MTENKYDYQFEQDAERARVRRTAVEGVREIGLYMVGGLFMVIVGGTIMISSALRLNTYYDLGEKLR